MKNLLKCGLLLAVCVFITAPANADSSQVPFPTAGDAYCSATNGCGTIPSGGQTGYMWTAGDYVISSNFTGTGLGSVTGLAWNFQVYDILGGGNNETVNILINNIVVGDIVVPDCNYCGQNMTEVGVANFAAISPANGGYTLELELTNTIPGGGGSIAFLDGGLMTLSGGSGSTPEPSSILLFGTGALGLAGVIRRKINR